MVCNSPEFLLINERNCDLFTLNIIPTITAVSAASIFYTVLPNNGSL
jgi:hypothetical protein